MLLQLSQFCPFCPLHQAPPIPSGNPYLYCCPCPWPYIYVLWLLHVLCCTLYPHNFSVTSNLYSLIPSLVYPSLQLPSYLATIKTFPVYLIWFLFCLFCFLDSIVDTYVFNAILLFIVLNFLKTLLTFHIMLVCAKLL